VFVAVGEDVFYASGDELLNAFHQKTGGNAGT